jgi:hypothetical protein
MTSNADMARPNRLPDEETTIRIIREVMARRWDEEEAPKTAARIRAGAWDDVSPVRDAIDGALAFRLALIEPELFKPEPAEEKRS